MSRRRRSATVASLASIVVASAAPWVRAEAPPGMVSVTLAPGEPELALRLNSFDGSPPVACDAACTVNVRPNVPYELAIVDRHGESSTSIYFSEPETVMVHPPDRETHTVGKRVLFAGVALFVISGAVFVYAATRNLSNQECETDCHGVSRSVVYGSLIGYGVSVPVMIVGGALVLGNMGPDIYRSPYLTSEPRAVGGTATISLGVEPAKQVHAPYVGWRVVF